MTFRIQIFWSDDIQNSNVWSDDIPNFLFSFFFIFLFLGLLDFWFFSIPRIFYVF